MSFFLTPWAEVLSLASGSFLLHVEGRGDPHCVSLKVDQDEAVMGGPAATGLLDECSQLTFEDFSQDP